MAEANNTKPRVGAADNKPLTTEQLAKLSGADLAVYLDKNHYLGYPVYAGASSILAENVKRFMKASGLQVDDEDDRLTAREITVFQKHVSGLASGSITAKDSC